MASVPEDGIPARRLQYRAFILVAIGVAGLTGLLYLSDEAPFRRYLGDVDPLLAMAFAAVSGFALLAVLLSRGWMSIYRQVRWRQLLPAIGLSGLLAGIAIVLDLWVRFPAGMNVLFPESLLFYPAIGFFVEMVFHVVPLALLLIGLTSLWPAADRKRLIWGSLVAVSLLEPVFQAAFMYGSAPLWSVVYVGIHLWMFDLLQLFTFWRYDFLSMYLLRLVYYLIWHIAWGPLRLEVLFAS